MAANSAFKNKRSSAKIKNVSGKDIENLYNFN